MDERCSLLIAELLCPGPCELQIADVALVDLVERAISLAVVGTSPHEPVIRTGSGRDFVADGREALDQGWSRERGWRAQHRSQQHPGRPRQVLWRHRKF